MHGTPPGCAVLKRSHHHSNAIWYVSNFPLLLLFRSSATSFDARAWDFFSGVESASREVAQSAGRTIACGFYSSCTALSESRLRLLAISRTRLSPAVRCVQSSRSVSGLCWWQSPANLKRVQKLKSSLEARFR